MFMIRLRQEEGQSNSLQECPMSHSSPERHTSIHQFVVIHPTGELAGNNLVVHLLLLSENLEDLPRTRCQVLLGVEPEPHLLVWVPRGCGGLGWDNDHGCVEAWMIPLMEY